MKPPLWLYWWNSALGSMGCADEWSGIGSCTDLDATPIHGSVGETGTAGNHGVTNNIAGGRREGPNSDTGSVGQSVDVNT